MIEIIGPFLLVVMRWDPELGMESVKVRLHHYATLEECQKSGSDLQKVRDRMNVTADRVQWRCVAAPEPIDRRVVPADPPIK